MASEELPLCDFVWYYFQSKVLIETHAAGTYTSRAAKGMLCRFLAPLEHKAYRITSLNYSPHGHDVLVSYSAENVYLFNTQVTDHLLTLRRSFFPSLHVVASGGVL